jgi:hypothetical protein
MSQIPLSQKPRVAVTGAGHLGSRPTDKHAAGSSGKLAEKYAVTHAAKHADAVFEVAADSNSRAASAGATAQDHNAAACTSLPADIPAMNAISPLVSSSRNYKLAGEFLEAGIPYFCEKYLCEKYLPEYYLREHYLREIHPRETSVIERMGATTDLPATDIILHLIGSPVERLVFTGKFPLVNGTNRANIDNDRGDAENHRFNSPDAILNTSDPRLEYESGLPIFMRRGQHQPVQPLTAASARTRA